MQLCRNDALNLSATNLSVTMNNKPQWRIEGVEINLSLSSWKALVGLSAQTCLGQVRSSPLWSPPLCLVHQCLGCSHPAWPATRGRAPFMIAETTTHQPHLRPPGCLTRCWSQVQSKNLYDLIMPLTSDAPAMEAQWPFTSKDLESHSHGREMSSWHPGTQSGQRRRRQHSTACRVSVSWQPP